MEEVVSNGNINLTSKQTGVLFEGDAETNDFALTEDITQFKKADKRQLKWVWRNIILFVYVHLAAVYGGYLFLFQAKWATIAFCMYTLRLYIFIRLIYLMIAYLQQWYSTRWA